jgi:RNA polymerase sigma-70 factor (ECF subfamily)
MLDEQKYGAILATIQRNLVEMRSLGPRPSPMTLPQSNPALATSQSLIGKLRSRDDSGWQRMVELYTPLIYHWCRRSGFGPEETADLTQDIFRSVFQSIDQFQRTGENGTFRGWLRTIFKSRVVDHVRRNRTEPAGRGGSEALRWLENSPQTPADDEADPATKALFRRVLDLIEGEFNGQAWHAFWLTTVEERPAREVALELGMTPGAVRQAKYRVLRRVREELGDVD